MKNLTEEKTDRNDKFERVKMVDYSTKSSSEKLLALILKVCVIKLLKYSQDYQILSSNWALEILLDPS